MFVSNSSLRGSAKVVHYSMILQALDQYLASLDPSVRPRINTDFTLYRSNISVMFTSNGHDPRTVQCVVDPSDDRKLHLVLATSKSLLATHIRSTDEKEWVAKIELLNFQHLTDIEHSQYTNQHVKVDDMARLITDFIGTGELPDLIEMGEKYKTLMSEVGNIEVPLNA